MIILAAAVIVTLSNSDIIERADEAVVKTDVAQLQQLASIAWAEAYADGVKEGKTLSQKDLEDAVNNYLIDNGYSEATLNNYDITVDAEGVVVSQKGSATPPKEPSEQEKFDQEFLVRQEQLLAENNNVMPETFQYGDYEYRYNQRFVSAENRWKTYDGLDGWGVKVIDNTKEDYGAVLSKAFGKDVKAFGETFLFCTKLTSLPEKFRIPSKATDVSSMFIYCENLTSIPDTVTIPSGATKASLMFKGCKSLTTLPKNLTLPEGVLYINQIFSGCTNLSSLPTNFVIPSSVVDLTYAFYSCSSLEGTVVINSTTTEYEKCFYGTTKPIVLTTTKDNVTREYLEKLAATSTNGNVTVDPAIQ